MISKDFTSAITLDQVSKRYYHPESEMELASLTRFEKVYTQVAETAREGAAEAARDVADCIAQAVRDKGRCVIAFGAGKCVLNVYDELVKLYFADKVTFANVVAFNIAELGMGGGHDGNQSTMERLNKRLFNKVDIEPHNIHSFSPEATKEDVHAHCKAYETLIDDFGGLDLVICELTKNGSLAYNEPGSTMTSQCRLMLLGSDTRTRVAEAYTCDVPPITAVTLGISNLLAAKHVIAVAWGQDSAPALFQTIEGQVTDQVPASFLQMHASTKIVADLEAASRLTRICYPWKVTSCEWTDKLIRRAIVWLCGRTRKPVLKLTNKDYNDHGLSELLALYGSAYNVNIMVFNVLQHTITGWPGGKPNADDTHRPERATPYPKRVLAFSPHPDNAIVSMGGTLSRLVQQGHDVHVAFATSGDVAVADDDLRRTAMLYQRIVKHMNITGNSHDMADAVTRQIEGKTPGSPDTELMRYLKGELINCEGIMACNLLGVTSNHIHELHLPFFNSHPQGRGRVTEADVFKVKAMIEQVQPHQIFVADELNDPFGTHEQVTSAILQAIDQLKNEPFMQECRVWMYRGQWGQWNVDQVEMAVPMSPDEFRDKRNAILMFQSQIHDAPFRDNADGKLSWQRSIDRNTELAQHYNDLGLAAYEAIEAFVQYHPSND
jgi:glucosamine-6-phosphate deaminase